MAKQKKKSRRNTTDADFSGSDVTGRRKSPGAIFKRIQKPVKKSDNVLIDIPLRWREEIRDSVNHLDGV